LTQSFRPHSASKRNE